MNVHIQHTLALMCAKNRINIFSSFLDIRQNVEWPRFFWPTLYVWRAYMNSPMLFRTVQYPTFYGLPFLEIVGLQLSYPLLSQEQVKLWNSNLTRTFTGPIRIKAH